MVEIVVKQSCDRRAWRGRRAMVVLFVAVMTATASNVAAQTNSFLNSGLQFDFPLPGARSLGLAGAFVAVADDATAAVANPAGLIRLRRPEVSFEARGWRFVQPVNLRGHAFGSPTGFGVDTVPGIVRGENPASAAGVSFVSVVLPLRNFSLGAYRQQQASYRADLSSEGPFYGEGATLDRMFPFSGSMTLDVATYGGAAAYQVRPGFSVGAGVALSTFSFETHYVAYYPGYNSMLLAGVPRTPQSAGLGQPYGPANFADTNAYYNLDETGDDKALAFNVGALYRPVAGRWSAGFSLRRNAEFDYTNIYDYGIGHPFTGGRRVPVGDPMSVLFKVPDVYSGGAAYRHSDNLTISTQYDRVLFSQLSRNMKDINTRQPIVNLTLVVPDSNQVRVGLEYSRQRRSSLITARFGVAYESTHEMYSTLENATLELLFPRDQPGQWHFTPGAGLAFTKFQIDAAADLSERTRTFSASIVRRF
jgi:long-chain fatty acid transport protein